MWTEKNKMKLNPKKTKNMVFNFSKNNQFTTDIKLRNESLEVKKEIKLQYRWFEVEQEYWGVS